MFLYEMHFADINYLDQSVRQYTKEGRTSPRYGFILKVSTKVHNILKKCLGSAISLLKEYIYFSAKISIDKWIFAKEIKGFTFTGMRPNFSSREYCVNYRKILFTPSEN